MIAVRIEGRLGNQLFQYAFAYSTAKRLKTSFYLDKGIQKYSLYDYFEVEKDRFYFFDRYVFTIQGFKSIFTYHFKGYFYEGIQLFFFKMKFKYFNATTPTIEVLNSLEDNCFYSGFYQSEGYFTDYKDDLKKHFKIKKGITEGYKNFKSSSLPLSKTIVTVHIRRTDYRGLEKLNLGGGDLSLPYSYYHKAIQQLNKEDSFFIFIADDIFELESEFYYLPNKYISQADEITDFQHMLQADVCIVANSTFSWWAAYLNNNPNKVVIAPRYFLGWRVKKQFPKEIYPLNWTLIEV